MENASAADVTEPAHSPPAPSRTSPDPAARPSVAAIAVGAVVGLIGLVLVIGGLWLAALGGSWYYLLAGIGLLASGGAIATGRHWGVWLYAGVVALTIIWAFWEAGADPWALVPRIAGPVLLLIAVVLVAPTLESDRNRWVRAWIAIGVLLVATIILFATLGIRQAQRVVAPLPPGWAMGDPSPLQPAADWPVYGGSYSARRYSPLDQINVRNVHRLRRAWIFHTGDLPSDAAKGTYGGENTPLKVGDMLYVCTPKNIVIGLNAATGRERWRFDPHVPDRAIPYTAACRGVAYYRVPGAAAGSACADRIIYGTLDARLIELDARTGLRCAAFGSNGEVDIKRGMGLVRWGYVSITAAPTIVRGVVVTGHQVLDGQDRWAASGVIQGYDAVDGRLRWAWDMMNPDRNGAPPPGETYARGTVNMWTTASGDERLGLVYLPMGNASADYWSGKRRPPENFYSSSLVALDVTTGKPRWRFQTVRRDVWDYDLGSQATLIDYPGAAGPVPALVLPSKQGEMYVLDRRTGRPITPVGEIRVPQTGVEPDQRSPTQPVSLWHTLRKPDLVESDMWGMSPIDQMICRIQFKKAVYHGFFTPPESDRHTIEYPGYNGGSDWGGVAVDPAHGLVIANYNDMPNYNKLIPRAQAQKMGLAPRDQARGAIGGVEGAGDPQANTPYAINVNAGWQLPFTGLLCKRPPYGGLRAIDLRTGRTVWDRPFGEARTNGPFGIPSLLRFTIGTPNNGGAVVTAGGVIFIAATTDNLIHAIDERTGKELWNDILPGGGQATPMVYSVGGREYLVIEALGHHFMKTPVSDAVIAYTLP